MAATDHAEREVPERDRGAAPVSLKWFIVAISVALLLATCILTYWCGIALPRRQLQEIVAHTAPREDSEYVRSVCHRVLKIPIGNFRNACVLLAKHGDETSVPVLIETLHWGPEKEPPRCICLDDRWSACIWALESLTNQEIDTMYRGWSAWYRKHCREPRLAWIADGFTARGFPCTRPGDEASVRSLLRASWEESFSRASRKAGLLLERYDAEMVRRVLDDVVRSGTPAEKKGSIEYLLASERAEGERLIGRLMADADVAVKRRAGSALLFRAQAARHGEAPTPRRRDLALKDHVTGQWAAEETIFYYQSDQYLVAYDVSRADALWRQDIGGADCRLAIASDCLVVSAGATTVTCLERATGARRWQLDLALVDSAAPAVAADYVIVTGFEEREGPAREPPAGARKRSVKKGKRSRPTVTVIRTPATYVIGRTSGIVRRKLEGSAVHAAAGTAFLLCEGALVKVSLPAGEAVPVIRSVPDEPRRIVLVNDVAVVAVTKEGSPGGSGREELWVEGWSLRTGQRRYATMVGGLGDGPFDYCDPRDARLSVSPNANVYVMTEELLAAIDPAGGGILWENDVCGQDDDDDKTPILVGEYLAVPVYYGELLALFSGETGEVIAVYKDIPEGISSRCQGFRAGDNLYLLCVGSLLEFQIPTSLRKP